MKRRRDGGNGRLYEQVARSLGASIGQGKYAVGTRLPSERELALGFGVSRPTVREAIIALEIDGLVEARVGSGVYVTHETPPSGKTGDTDAGPFELIEARRAIEGEVCAIAAARIDEERLAQLEALIVEMDQQNVKDVTLSEVADRRFHMLIAEATENVSLLASVTSLWDARERSPQYRSLSLKAHAAGVIPRVDEHRAILSALRARDAEAARAAMREHLTRVFRSLLDATEVEEVERARALADEKRQRYALPHG